MPSLRTRVVYDRVYLAAVEDLVDEAQAAADAAQAAVDALEGEIPPTGARLVTASDTITTDDYVIIADATAGAIVLTLPNAATGGEHVVKKIDGSANTVTVDGLGGQQINGAPTYVLTAINETVRVVADGSLDWYTS
jgi:formylmethanofuran:tetrahydromethanopterin formyltransferase